MLAQLSLEQETALSPQATAEAIRLQQLRAQAMQAFQDDDDEDGEDGSSVEDEEMTRTLPVQVRAPGLQLANTGCHESCDLLRQLFDGS